MTSGALCLGIGKTGAPISLVIFVKHKRTAHSSSDSQGPHHEHDGGIERQEHLRRPRVQVE